jgi:hypothetical protein
VVGLGIDDNVIDGIERFSSVIRLTAEGHPCVFGGKIRPSVRVRVIDDFDRTEAPYTLIEKTHVFHVEIVGVAGGAREALRIQGVVAVLLIHAGAHFVNCSGITRSDKKATALFGIGLSGMGVDFSQYLVRKRQE